MRFRSRTKQTGWLVNGQFMTLQEAARNYGLHPADVPLSHRARVGRWWYEVRDYWARKIAP